MPQRHGLANNNIAIAIMAVVVEIRAAKTCRADCDLEFVGAWRKERARFLEALLVKLHWVTGRKEEKYYSQVLGAVED